MRRFQIFLTGVVAAALLRLPAAAQTYDRRAAEVLHHAGLAATYGIAQPVQTGRSG